MYEMSCFISLLPDTVCRLYLDLEFEFKFNEDKDGARMTEVFLKVSINQKKIICTEIQRIIYFDVTGKKLTCFNSSTPCGDNRVVSIASCGNTSLMTTDYSGK
jgi:hypothetical protein